MEGTRYYALHHEQRIDAETSARGKDGKTTWSVVFTRSCRYGEEGQRGCLKLQERVRERVGTEREGVCCNEALSVEMLKRFQRYPVGDCEVRWKRNVTKGCNNNTSRLCIDKG